MNLQKAGTVPGTGLAENPVTFFWSYELADTAPELTWQRITSLSGWFSLLMNKRLRDRPWTDLAENPVTLFWSTYESSKDYYRPWTDLAENPVTFWVVWSLMSLQKVWYRPWTDGRESRHLVHLWVSKRLALLQLCCLCISIVNSKSPLLESTHSETSSYYRKFY